MKTSQKGFATLLIIIIVIVLIGTYMYVNKRNDSQESVVPPVAAQAEDTSPDSNVVLKYETNNSPSVVQPIAVVKSSTDFETSFSGKEIAYINGFSNISGYGGESAMKVEADFVQKQIIDANDPWGYKIVNENPKLRYFAIRQDVKIEAGIYNTQVKSLERLAAFVKKNNADAKSGKVGRVWYTITVNQGLITDIYLNSMQH